MERSTLLRKNLVAIAIECQHSAICEDADTAIAPALRFPLRAETAIGSLEVWFFGHIEKARTKRLAPSLIQLPASSTRRRRHNSRRNRTCCVRRLHRSCKAERDHCHQHHC